MCIKRNEILDTLGAPLRFTEDVVFFYTVQQDGRLTATPLGPVRVWLNRIIFVFYGARVTTLNLFSTILLGTLFFYQFSRLSYDAYIRNTKVYVSFRFGVKTLQNNSDRCPIFIAALSLCSFYLLRLYVCFVFSFFFTLCVFPFSLCHSHVPC